jgi:hypothetical protein
MKNPPLDFSPMPPEEYVADLKALGLAVSHADKTRNPRRSAAYLFGFSPRESRYYASGRREIPHALAALIRILVVLHYTADQIANAGPLTPPTPKYARKQPATPKP